jgi:hypothetical protein
VYAKRYNAAGVVQGSEFRVNTFTTGAQRTPSAAMEATGNFIVTWESFGQDGSSYGVYAKRYNAAGVAEAGEFRVNTSTNGGQSDPSVGMSTTGGLIVAWVSQDSDGSGVYAQRYNAAGVAQGGEFRVNTHVLHNQMHPSVVMDADADFIVTWQDNSGQAGDSYDVYAQRYAPLADAATVSGRVFEDVDGDGIQDPTESGRDGVEVVIYNPFGSIIQDIFTSGGGKYQFVDVVAGEQLSTQFAQPANRIFTFGNVGLDDKG